MWQAETFDPKRMDLELGWEESIGLNTMRVFLHDLLWKQDAAGSSKRLDEFLGIAAEHHIRPGLVVFDFVLDPHPKVWAQAPPRPGGDNSRRRQRPRGERLGGR